MKEDDLIHRDDIPMDAMEEIEWMFPNAKVVCIGDQPEGTVPPEVQKAIAALTAKFEDSLRKGLCVDCGVQMPGYPPNDWDAWTLPDGWQLFTGTRGEPQAFQCPVCDEKETDSVVV
jgi:hypothetical protein